ncbi:MULTISPECIES: hypothetical protein [Streptomyces]|uniref:hypothetical protein n=1 Tax=Streptomyces TaxID=1883 RepID=UPI00017E7FD5|nr:hypothetical protein [Streptomyces sp. Mg1]AKL71031.1 hypothetical protein M444_37275 [Streptomyces sp. Mg1]EDX22836.1 hypothetical protein SSAG_02627 [Streptomyces sp. Mg1]
MVHRAFSKSKLCSKETAAKLGTHLAARAPYPPRGMVQEEFLDRIARSISGLWAQAHTTASSPGLVEQIGRKLWEHLASGENTSSLVTEG